MAQTAGPADRDGPVTGEILVRDVVRATVADVAPDELPLVEGLLQFDDAAVVRRFRKRTQAEEPLGFGLGEVAALVTPVVWLALDDAARRVAGATVDGASRVIKVGLRRLVRRPAEPATLPPLTRDQLSEVHRGVMESARRNEIDDRLATALADAVVARLAMDDPSQPACAHPADSDGAARHTGSQSEDSGPDPQSAPA
jgi:hypothetical protein